MMSFKGFEKMTIFEEHHEGGLSTCQPTLLGHGGSTMWEQSKQIQLNAPLIFSAVCVYGDAVFTLQDT